MKIIVHPWLRFLVAMIFLLSGSGNLFAFKATAARMGALGYSSPSFLLTCAIDGSNRMKQTNLYKFGGLINKLLVILFVSAMTISVWGQTERESAAKMPDVKKKTVVRQEKNNSTNKAGEKLKDETDQTDNQTAAEDEDAAKESETNVQTRQPAHRRIVDPEEMKKRRSSFGNRLLAPFRAVAPIINSNLTSFETGESGRLALIFGNPYVHPLIGGLGAGSGFGGGVYFSTANKLSPDYKLFASGHATFSGYAEILGGIEAAPKNWAGGKVKLNLTGRYLLRPQENYFGTGANSFRSHRTTYFRREQGAKFDVGWQAFPRLKIGAFADFSLDSISDGKNKKIARITERFDQFDTPGLARSVRLLDTGVYVEYEGRDQPENPHAGTYLRAAVSSVDGLGKNNDYAWMNYDFDARGYIPLGSKRRVLALRLLGNFKDTKGNSTVPFYRFARLGGADTLRGYENYRYQGLNQLHLNVEYRFKLMQGIETGGFRNVEAILFTDLGQVFNRRRELAFENIQSSYGGGLQFASRENVVFRILYAVSPEKSGLILGFGKTF